MVEEGLRATGGNIITYIRTLIGTYTPTDPTSMAGADWEYIFAGIILVVTLYSVFRLIYAVFK